ncbi:hypothetical protein CONCODRAFT_78523 [Conidiobolus coronatus NRRL 28638]|uniref:Stc1 domain-containing protein n=1 Tax=Conidiobolus coronatus (strain ATCC 28846 / CBS 209.66 / NRRL 28638) TaxID=796925 RepID=A0A137P7V5_CONC2|nr:hypothetical protein CONCODRAFT_78523 [Conidiobolus coronatus NRRL 28638]|eukprot:KXN71086.1 hypothetical protein CONCODRAFT_78523 [Conidiobolus coronatus NRRL 28638]
MVRKYNFNSKDLTCRCCEKVCEKSQFSNKALVRLYRLTTIQSGNEKGAYIRKFYRKMKCNNCMIKKRPDMRCYSCKYSMSLINFTVEQINKGDRALCKGCTTKSQEDVKSPELVSSEFVLPEFKDSNLSIQSKNDIMNQELLSVNNNELNCNQHETIDLTINRRNDHLKNNMCTICMSKCNIHLCCRDCRNTMILVKFPRDQRDKGDKALCNICTKKSQENALLKLNRLESIDLEISDKKTHDTNNICTICESICIKHLRCCACMNTMRMDKFNKTERTNGDKACCYRCKKRETKKQRLELESTNSNALSVSNNSCSICKSNCSIHIYCCVCLETKSVECYSINQKDNDDNAICYNCEANSQEINEIYSNSEKNSISSPSNSANSFEISDQIQDTENSNSVLVDKNNSMFINIAQDEIQLKDKEQAYSDICEPISMPRFNKNIYSLSQLIGRKNPPVFNDIYTPFEMPEEYEAENHDEIDMKENPTPSENLLLFNNDSAYNQNDSQKVTNGPPDIKEYVRQFVDSIYNHSLDQ